MTTVSTWTGPRKAAAGMAAAGTVAFAWAASGVRTFTRPAEALIGVAIAVTFALATVTRPSLSPLTSASLRLRSASGWLGALLALIAWELVELVQSPRTSHPTLSSLAEQAMSTHPARFVGVLLWLALGGALARR